MKKNTGYIYIMVYDAHKGWVKIGYSKNPVKRARELSVGRPCKPARIYATLSGVPYLADTKFHPYISAKAKRWNRTEWFKISAQEAYKILGRFHRNSGIGTKLEKWDAKRHNEKSVKGEIDLQLVDLQILPKGYSKSVPLRFSMIKLGKGKKLTFKHNGKVGKVLILDGGTKVKYGKKVYRNLTSLGCEITGKKYFNWPSDFFRYNGKTLHEIRKMMGV